MSKRLVAFVLLGCVPASWAEPPAAAPAGPPAPAFDALPAPEKRTRSPRLRPLVLAGTALGVATILDVESTFELLDRCPRRCRESNAFLRGVVESGRGWTYGIQAALNTGVMYAAYRARRSSKRTVRRSWWVPIAIVGFAHVTGAALNLTHEGNPRDAAAARLR